MDPSVERDDSPRNNKGKSYSRSPSRGRKPNRDDRDHRRDDRDRDYSFRRDRSHSQSRSDRRRKSSRYSRSRSRSPEYGRFHSESSFDKSKPTNCLGVFGLCVHTTEVKLYHIFSKYGPVERVQLVIDAKTGKSRGFAFVYFENTADAKVAKNQCTSMEINGRSVRVDYSLTERPHSPTPGIYMGKPTRKYSDRYGGRRRDRYVYYRSSRYNRPSPSPHYSSSSRRRYSRSRSYSPRRY